MEANETYVRSKWERVFNCGTRRHPHVQINSDVPIDRCSGEWDQGWQAAADVTRQREEQIRQAEEEIEWLHFASTAAVNSSLPIIGRILARLEAVLADLTKGFKP